MFRAAPPPHGVMAVCAEAAARSQNYGACLNLYSESLAGLRLMPTGRGDAARRGCDGRHVGIPVQRGACLLYVACLPRGNPERVCVHSLLGLNMPRCLCLPSHLHDAALPPHPPPTHTHTHYLATHTFSRFPLLPQNLADYLLLSLTQGWFGNLDGIKYVFPTSALPGHVWYQVRLRTSTVLLAAHASQVGPRFAGGGGRSVSFAPVMPRECPPRAHGTNMSYRPLIELSGRHTHKHIHTHEPVLQERMRAQR